MLCTHSHVKTRPAFNARSNPLRVDPTRTGSIQRRFIAEVKRRFRRLRLAVRDFIDHKDALALKEHSLRSLIFHAHEREFEFRTDEGKLEAFNDWFRDQVEADIFSVDPGTPSNRPWTAEYVESAYKRGQINAYLAAKAALIIEAGDAAQEEFLRTAFNQPEAVRKVRLLATRAFEELKGVTASMSARMNVILAQGMVDGSGAVDIAREMATTIDSLTRTRALTIARTEIINAHAEGQLDSFEQMGVKELGIKAEWSTAGDERVCPLCAPREGRVYSMKEARGLIPLHPNCRCAWLPVV